jgi:hypothetical protein
VTRVPTLHAKVYMQIATRIWEKISGGTQQRPAPRIMVQ